MTRSAPHTKAIEILETLGAYECEEFLAGKITTDELKTIVIENRYDRRYRGISNIAFEQCLANVVYG